MKKLLLSLLALGGLGTVSFAQTPLKVSGNILDEKSAGFPFVNVLLLKAADSTLVKGGITDLDGKFDIEGVAANKYIIAASMVGYKKYYSPPFILNAENPSVKLQSIGLQQVSGQLKEVTVTGKKPLIEQQADKLVMNVEASVVAAGSTAMEVLEKAPGVRIDQNDNISLKGKSGVLIYMDGKQTFMSPEQLATLLKNTNSDQIEKIEIISNPSSKYDAAGNSGIINIIMKRNKNFGTNGSATIGAAFSVPPALNPKSSPVIGNLPKANFNLQLNNRQGKFNTFGSLGGRFAERFNTNNIFRNLDGRQIDQFSMRQSQSQNLSWRLGTDYFLSKKTTIGVLANGNFGKWMPASNNIVNDTYISSNEGLQSIAATVSNMDESWVNTTLNSNLKHSFNDKGLELTADLDYSTFVNKKRENGMITRFLNPQKQEVAAALNITSDIPNKYDIIAAKADLVIPASKNAKVEVGVKTSFVKSDNNIKFFNNAVLDAGRSNHFLYTENINAAYVNYNKQLSEQWSMQLGLRGEQTNARGESLTQNEKRERHYFNLFPTVFVSNNLNKDNQLSLNYSRRIQRPPYETLNPFIFFLDPYTYQTGNEYLQPQKTHNVEFTHTFKQAFVTSVGYSYMEDLSTQVIKNAISDPAFLARLEKYNYSPQIDPRKITIATNENIGTGQSVNLAVSAPIPVAKWWMMQNNLVVAYNTWKGQIANMPVDVQNLTSNINITNMFTVKGGWSAEVSGFYQSPFIESQFKGRSMGGINVGLSKSFLNKAATFRLNASDILGTNRFKGETVGMATPIYLDNNWDSRQIRATFIYRFGNQQVKSARNRQTATSQEQQRVGGNN